MSQRKPRQSSEEVMAARERFDSSLPEYDSQALPENVVPFSDDLTKEESEAEEAMAAAEKISDEEMNDFLNQEECQQPDSAPDVALEEAPAPECENKAVDCTPQNLVECPYCGNVIAVEPENGLEGSDLAAKYCGCKQAKATRNSARMTEKIDMLFGQGSSRKYGFPDEHTEEELNMLKGVGALVAQRQIKGVTVVMENGDRAVIQTIKDNTKVARKKATKAEAEA